MRKAFLSKSTKSIAIGLTACLAFACLKLSAEPSVTASTQVQEGVRQTDFQTSYGTLHVYVPDDVADGDTISGTVVAEPAGETDEEKQKNEDTLAGYVVDVKPKAQVQAQTKPQTETCNLSMPDFSCLIPERCPAITISICNSSHTPICNNDVPCASVPPPLTCKPDQAILPKQGTCGKPAKIKGKCDGKFGNSSVLINKRKCRMLAESPRQQVCLVPTDFVGNASIESIEGPRIVSAMFQILPAPPREVPRASTEKAAPSAKRFDLSGSWTMTGTADGHSDSAPCPVSQNGNNVSWHVADTEYTGVLSGNTIQFTMNASYWTGTGSVTVDSSGQTMTGNCHYTFTQAKAPPGDMALVIRRN